MFLIRFLKALLKERPKSGHSIRGFFGEIRHFNKHGVQIGYTIRGFWGQRKRFDMDGNLVSVSWRNFWGGCNTYDAAGNLIRRSYRNIRGGYNTYDRFGKKIWESYRNFWNGMNHYDVENPDSEETFTVEKRKVSMTNAEKAMLRALDNTMPSSSAIGNTSSITYSSNKQSTGLAAYRTSARVVKEKTVESKTAVRKTADGKATESRNAECKTVESNAAESKEAESKASDGKEAERQNVENKPVPRKSFEKQGSRKAVRYYSGISECVNDKKIEHYVRLLVFQHKNFAEFPALAYRMAGDRVRVEPLQMDITPFEFSVSEIEKARKEMVTDLDMKVIDEEFMFCVMDGAGKGFEDLLPEYPFASGGVYRMQYVLECGMVITEKSMEELRKL